MNSKNALQTLWDSVKRKINACYTALSLLSKLYKDKSKRYAKENPVWIRLSGLLAYQAKLLNLKYNSKMV